MAKGYGKVSPRFAKYFARHKNSSGAHDPKNAKQQEVEEIELDEMLEEAERRDTIKRFPKVNEIFDVNEQVRVIAGDYEGECGRIVIRRQDNGDMSYGIVFPWDVSMIPHYVSGNQIERDND